MFSIRPVLRNLVSLGLIQASNLVLPLLIIPVIISRIGVAEFGELAFIQATIFFSSAIVDFGYIITGTRKAAKSSPNTMDVSKLYSTSLVLRGLIMITLFISVSLLLILLSAQKNMFYFIVAFSYVAGQWLQSSWIFHGFQKIHIAASIILSGRVFFFAGVLLFAVPSHAGLLYLLFFGLGNLVSGIIALYVSFRLFGLVFKWPLTKDLIREFKENLPVALCGLAMQAYLYLNFFFARLFCSEIIVGYFAIADRIIHMFRQGLSVFSQATFPQVCALSIKKFQLGLFFKKIYLPFFIIVLLLCAALNLFSTGIVSYFTRSHSGAGSGMLFYLSLIPLIICLNIPANQLVLAFDRRATFFRIVFTALFISLIGNLLMGQIFGISGIICSMIITEVFIAGSLNLAVFRISSDYKLIFTR